MTDNSAFEGMFARALKPTGQFLEELKAVGYDPAKPQIRYPSSVWSASLEVARRHCFASLARDEGMRALGRRFVEGWFETIAGRFMAAAMPLVGTAGVINRLPRYWATVRKDTKVEVHREDERRWRIVYRDAHLNPEFCAGIIQAAGKHTKSTHDVQLDVKIPVRTAEGFELLVTY